MHRAGPWTSPATRTTRRRKHERRVTGPNGEQCPLACTCPCLVATPTAGRPPRMDDASARSQAVLRRRGRLPVLQLLPPAPEWRRHARSRVASPRPQGIAAVLNSSFARAFVPAPCSPSSWGSLGQRGCPRHRGSLEGLESPWVPCPWRDVGVATELPRVASGLPPSSRSEH